MKILILLPLLIKRVGSNKMVSYNTTIYLSKRQTVHHASVFYCICAKLLFFFFFFIHFDDEQNSIGRVWFCIFTYLVKIYYFELLLFIVNLFQFESSVSLGLFGTSQWWIPTRVKTLQYERSGVRSPLPFVLNYQSAFVFWPKYVVIKK